MKIGPTIRDIRKNRRLTAAHVYTGIMSRNAYSTFENGVTDTSTTNLIALVGRLGIKFSELGDFLDQKSDANENSRAFDYRNQLANAYSLKDSLALERLLVTVTQEYEQTNYIRFRHIILWLKGYNTGFDRTSPEALEIREYLFSIEHWYSYEFSILSFFTWVFDPQSIFELRISILNQAAAINRRRKDVDAIYLTLGNILRIQLIEQQYANARTMINELYKMKFPLYDVYPFLQLELFTAMLEYYLDKAHNPARLLRHKNLLAALPTTSDHNSASPLPFVPVLLRDLNIALAYPDGSHLLM